jgi:hypothetical protein
MIASSFQKLLSKKLTSSTWKQNKGTENKSSGLRTHLPTLNLKVKFNQFVNRIRLSYSSFASSGSSKETEVSQATSQGEQSLEFADKTVGEYVSKAVALEDPTATVVDVDVLSEGSDGLVIAIVQCERADKTVFCRAVKLMPASQHLVFPRDNCVFQVMVHLMLQKMKQLDVEFDAEHLSLTICANYSDSNVNLMSIGYTSQSANI